MAKLLRLRRGTDTQHTTFTGAEGEVTVNTTNDSLHVHDGTTAGGREVMRADKNNMPNSGVTAGTYGSSSAIPSITVDAKGLVTSATTNAIDSTSIANGTSNVSVAASGDITLTRAGSTKLTANSGGLSVNGNVALGDGHKAVFGASDDLQIFHDGTQSFIHDAGTGSLVIKADELFIQNAAGTENKAYFQSNAHSALYYDNSEKLNTTSTGINVTGSVTCDGLTVDGNGTINGLGTIQNSTGVLVLRDNNDGAASAAQNYIEGRTSDGVARYRVGDVGSTGHVYISNLTSNGIIFQTGGSSRCYISSAGHFLPQTNNTYDLGSTGERWRNVYTNDLNLSNEGGTNDVDGTWGSWTIQEGEDDLFLLNRRNGKKYKFNLSEVN